MALDLDYYKKLNSDFHRKVGTINWYEDLEAIGLTPLNVGCSFWECHLEMLLKFCHDHPEYHIITRLSAHKTVNRLVRGGYLFSLASGDKDPDLERVYPPEVVDHMMRENQLYLEAVKAFRRF